jgi:carbon starvation protein
VALAVGTTVIINAGRARYAWVTLLPLSFVAITTLTAGAMSVRDNFYPMAIGPDVAKHFQGYLNSIVTVVMMICVLVILASAILRWMAVLTGKLRPAQAPS